MSDPMPPIAARRDVRNATAALLLAAVCFGLAPWFARSLLDAGLSPTAVAFFRFLTSATMLAAFLRLRGEQRTATLWALASGVGLGVSWITYVEALRIAPIATVGVLYMTYPLFTLVIAWAWLGRPVTSRSATAGILVVVAATLALAPSLGAPAERSALLLSLIAPIGFGFAICVLTHKLFALSALERAAGVSLGATIGLLPVVATLPPDAVVPADAAGWSLIIGISVVTALAPNVLLSTFGPRLGHARTATTSSFELPVMFVVGLLAFGEPIGMAQLTAAALVMAAIVLSPPAVPRRAG